MFYILPSRHKFQMVFGPVVIFEFSLIWGQWERVISFRQDAASGATKKQRQVYSASLSVVTSFSHGRSTILTFNFLFRSFMNLPPPPLYHDITLYWSPYCSNYIGPPFSRMVTEARKPLYTWLVRSFHFLLRLILWFERLTVCMYGYHI